MTRTSIQVTGHRGAAAIEPENTLRGLRYAMALGVDRVEIDVRLCRDGSLVVMHDEAVDRTTNGTGKVADLNLAQIKSLDAGLGESVPTLQEVITVCQEAWQSGCPTQLLIELKGESTAAPAVEVVQHHHVAEQVSLISFSAERVAEVKRLLPAVATGFIASSLEPDPVEVALGLGANTVHLRHDLATREWVERAHAAGLATDVWNIDDPKLMERAIALGVDGISSNDPKLLLSVLANHRR